jgi:hypothetical protein
MNDSGAGKAQVRWTITVAILSIAFCLYAFVHERAWVLVGALPLRPMFADLIAILAAGQAQEAGLNPYLMPNAFDPFGRPHVYGPGWLVTGVLGLTTEDAWWLGSLLMVAFVGTAAAVLAPRRRMQAAFALALICSPPVLLGINRGNNDLIVFMMFAAAAWLLTRPGPIGMSAGTIVLGVSALLKLYPFVTLPAVIMRPGRWRSLALSCGAAICVCGLLLALGWGDYRQALANAPRPQTVFAYGVPMTATIWRVLPDYHAVFATGWAIGAIIAAAVFSWRLKAVWRSVPTTGFSSVCFLTGAISWSFCFIMNSNFTYRIVLVLLAARFWLDQDSTEDEHRVSRLQLIAWTTVCWLGLPKYWWARLASDYPSVGRSTWIWLNAIVGLEQGLVTMLTIVLIVAVAGAFVRRFREAQVA